ncbi:MAG: FG-GAP repeat domain-containing protein [Bacteroidales bacterium]
MKQAFIHLSTALIITTLAATSWLYDRTGTENSHIQPVSYKPVIISESVKLPVRDADGIALGDITGNGKMDILTSEGDYGSVIWFEQGKTWKDWTMHHIYTIENLPNEIEGNALGDFNGDGWYEAISLGQDKGDIFLHKHGGDPRGEWQTSVIQAERQMLQDAMITDIDGDGRPDIVYTWEGRQKGHGGVHWLKLTGNDPLNPDHWQDYIMAKHESAWWLAPRRADFSGNGKAEDIVFTARRLLNRNPGAKPGLFWMEPAEDVTEIWKVHPIDESIPHPLHVDMGDLSGEGHGLDLVVGGFDTRLIYWYEYSKGWERHELELPAVNGVEPDLVWNVKTIRLGSGRESIIAPVTKRGINKGALVFYDFTDGNFQPLNLRNINYNHPMDDRIELFDITGDGQAEVFIPDSGPQVDLLHILQLRRLQIEP